MEKFCVFCGSKPESKNKEHVIPQWLIKMTGDPNREINLGYKWHTDNFEKRKFSFSAFTLPACEGCNLAHSELENSAMGIVHKILTNEAIGLGEWDSLMDWLDKVRIGLWLSQLYLNNNWKGIDPLFYIGKRISGKDRFLIIYKIIDDGLKGVNWSGTESPIFQTMPSAFGLCINNYYFFNVSYDFLFSERIGFPFPTNIKFRPEGGYCMELLEGTGYMKFPLVLKKFKTGGTQLFQPIIPWGFIFNENANKCRYEEYDKTYVKERCMDYERGKGKIYRRDRWELKEISYKPSSDWIPKQQYPRGDIFKSIGFMVWSMLEELYSIPTGFDLLSEDIAIHRKEDISANIELHRTMVAKQDRQKINVWNV